MIQLRLQTSVDEEGRIGCLSVLGEERSETFRRVRQDAQVGELRVDSLSKAAVHPWYPHEAVEISRSMMRPH